ncbi:hypothetical protein DV096_12895 [Bradymonadaceae bacterium TMQ3]|nr:hypothetical protein DV096_12895 [Bradymonadaceae bacterium TMQ3]TXC74964.1 hypothetical protein FRC91_12770 [Bradymonadales bacterium TMQ1]
MSVWKKVVLFLVGFVLLDFVFGSALDFVEEGVRSGEGIGLIRVASEQEAIDLLVLGSSRAKHHVDTEWLREAKSIRTYNLGMNGRGAYNAYLTLGLLLEKGPKPRAVLLQVEPRDLRGIRFERTKYFHPSIRKSQFLRETLPEYGDWMHVKLISRVYRHNNRVFSTVMRGIFARGVSEANSGFVALNRKYHDVDVEGWGYDHSSIDTRSIDVYRATLDLLAEHEIPVVIFEGPEFRNSTDGWDQLFREEMGKLISNYSNARFEAWDESTFSELDEQGLYVDPLHLNGEGARLFTQKIAETEAFEALLSGVPSVASQVR